MQIITRLRWLVAGGCGVFGKVRVRVRVKVTLSYFRHFGILFFKTVET